MSDQVGSIASRMQQAGAESAEFFRALKPSDWDQPIYEDGPQWTVRQVLHHFVSAERANTRLLRDIAAGGAGAPEDFDIDRFNASETRKFPDRTPPEMIAAFEETRAATLALIESLSDSDLERQGRHPWLGLTEIEKIIKLIYRHNMLHQRDIQKALENGQPIPSPE
jgi:uncharacterized protein (TIGR03083 family)